LGNQEIAKGSGSSDNYVHASLSIRINAKKVAIVKENNRSIEKKSQKVNHSYF
jgi:hypothetical protein